MSKGPLSEEHKTAIADAIRGRSLSDETKEKIRQTRLGSSLTDDHKLSLTLASLKRWARARGEDPDVLTLDDARAYIASGKQQRKKPKPSAVTASPREVTAVDATPVKSAKLKIRLTAEEVRLGRLDPARFAQAPAVAPVTTGPTVIDCQGFAGGMTLGAVQAGLTLIHKAEEPEGFGMPMCKANRGLLGYKWEGQASAPAKWEVMRADGIVGNPPCSGFSVMSPSSFRGIDSEINQCMKNLFAYARAVRPHFVVMESVQSAFKIGLPLMRELAASMGPGYFATHVLQNNLALGGCTERKRYFLVVTDFPFGVESEPLKWVPTIGDAIGDLRTLPLQWAAQQYDQPPTWWSLRQRTQTAVDGHQTQKLGEVHQKRLDDIMNDPERPLDWPPGHVWTQVLKRYYEKYSDMPQSYKYQSQSAEYGHLTYDKVLIEKEFNMGGYAQTRHWPWDRPGYVITGHGPNQAWHPDGRHFTHRETARVMGFPDDWLIDPIRSHPQLAAMWGKGVSVDCGRWVCTWVLNSMNGNPGSNRGLKLDDGDDRVIDVSHDHKKVLGGV